MQLSNGEKLILAMLCDIQKHLKISGGIDPAFVASAISSGNLWALRWEYTGILHGEDVDDRIVDEAARIMSMWSLLERSVEMLSSEDRDRLAEEAAPFGTEVRFPGFDGNNESTYLNVADFLVRDMRRYHEFAGRDLNSHMPTLDGHRRMLAVFEPIIQKLFGRDLQFTDVVDILKARQYPG